MPGTLVLCLTINTTSGVLCRVGGRTFCHTFLDFSVLFYFFYFTNAHYCFGFALGILSLYR